MMGPRRRDVLGSITFGVELLPPHSRKWGKEGGELSHFPPSRGKEKKFSECFLVPWEAGPRRSKKPGHGVLVRGSIGTLGRNLLGCPSVHCSPR